MSATLRWLPSVPDEIRAQFEPVLARLLFLLPGWVSELAVEWDASEGHASLRNTISHEYRQGCLTVCPSWLDGDAARRRKEVVHELAHFGLDPLHDFTVDLLNELTRGDERLERLLRERRRQVIELATTDLTDMLLKAMERGVVDDPFLLRETTPPGAIVACDPSFIR